MNPNDIATKQDINMLHEKINLLLNEITKMKSSEEKSRHETYLTSREVVKIYKLSKSHLTDLRVEGKIPHSKPFGIYLYPQSEIENIIMKNRSVPKQ